LFDDELMRGSDVIKHNLLTKEKLFVINWALLEENLAEINY